MNYTKPARTRNMSLLRSAHFTAALAVFCLLSFAEPAHAVQLRYDAVVDALNPGGAYEQVLGGNGPRSLFGTVSGRHLYAANGASSNITVQIDTDLHTALVSFGDSYGSQKGQSATFTVNITQQGNDFYSYDTTTIGEARFVPPKFQTAGLGANGITYPMHLMINEHTGYAFALLRDTADPAIATILGWWSSFDQSKNLPIFGYEKGTIIRGDFAFHVKLRGDGTPEPGPRPAPAPVPEPSCVALLFAGLVGLAGRRRKQLEVSVH